MHRSLVILALIGACSAAVVPPAEKHDVQSSKQSSSSTSLQGSQLQPAQYYYPTYPEYGANGNVVPSGYEGYLVPTALLPQRNSHWLTDIATSLFPFSSQLLFYGARVGASLLHLLFIVALGGAFTTLLCTFTPVCTISFFGFGISKSQVKEQVAELARTYITAESVNAATVLVTRAIDKYTAMQREKNEGTRREETERLNNAPKILDAQ